MLIMLFMAFTGISSYSLPKTNYYVSAQIKKVKFNQTFILQPAETVQTEDGKLRVRLKGVGRTISESGEVEYLELQVWLGKSERTITISEKGGRSRLVGDYLIKLVNAESFGKPKCELQILRKGKRNKEKTIKKINRERRGKTCSLFF